MPHSLLIFPRIMYGHLPYCRGGGNRPRQPVPTFRTQTLLPLGHSMSRLASLLDFSKNYKKLKFVLKCKILVRNSKEEDDCLNLLWVWKWCFYGHYIWCGCWHQCSHSTPLAPCPFSSFTGKASSMLESAVEAAPDSWHCCHQCASRTSLVKKLKGITSLTLELKTTPELLLNLLVRNHKEDVQLNKFNAEFESRTLLSRLEITHGEHPTSIGETSVWNQFLQEMEIID